MASYPNFELERGLFSKYRYVCGIDEVGRGPIAGPVVAGAVILPQDFDLDIGINDSKKISEPKRFEIAEIIKQNAEAWSVAYADIEKIEEINILQATIWAMKKSIAKLSPKPDFLLIDGNYFPNSPLPYKTVVKGDVISLSIAAASIIAKAERDTYMIKMAEKYPEYSFEKHKGYGTKNHYAAIDKFGTTPIHRPSFLNKYFEKKKQQSLF